MIKLTPEERRALANAAVTPNNETKADPNLLRVIRDLTDAVKAIKTPTIPEFDVGPIAKAIADLPKVNKSLDGLREDVRALTKAVASMQPANMNDISEAIASLEMAQKATVAAMRAPKEIICDKDGMPVGIRVARPN
jgi:hypothetical protein